LLNLNGSKIIDAQNLFFFYISGFQILEFNMKSEKMLQRFLKRDT